jgi:hypothetical protein
VGGLPWWQTILVTAFIVPLVELLIGIYGTVHAQWFFKKNPARFSRLVIQITTVGREHELVQRTVDTIRKYDLDMSYEIWVCIEPGFHTDYTDADRVIVVPKEFTCLPVDKARALEYTRLLRVEDGLNRDDVKIIFVDDDTLPSDRYIKLAYSGDYDVCQGPTIPNRWYAVGGFKHFMLSHLDDPRARNCIVYCSLTQGVTGHPLYVHGEGLCITGRCEDIVTWDWPIVGSDDLTFGTNAGYMGLKWGYFNAAIQLVSPWSWKEHLNQRWRWTWGNLDAIFNRKVMPLGAAIMKLGKYVMGYATVTCSITAIILVLLGILSVDGWLQVVFYISLGAWLFSYGLPGWLNAGGAPNRELRPQAWRYWGFRLVQFLAGAALTPITALAPMAVITYCVLRGRPKRFVMIKKANAAMGL